jgi:NADH:ubiquinone oxidoreductase subunit E
MGFEYLKQLEPSEKNLIRGLQLVQEQEGFISDLSMEACAAHFNVSLARVEGVVTFYAQFRRTKLGKNKINICDGTACHIKGSSLIEEWVETELGISAGQTDKDGLFSLNTVACLGCCSLAPVLSVNGKIFGSMDRKQTIKLLKNLKRQG